MGLLISRFPEEPIHLLIYGVPEQQHKIFQIFHHQLTLLQLLMGQDVPLEFQLVLVPAADLHFLFLRRMFLVLVELMEASI